MSYDKDYYLQFGHHNDNIGFILRHHKEIRKRGRVLVVPCGYGQIVNWCLSNSIDCDGFDISEYVLSIAQPHLKNQLFLQDARTMPASLHKYGAIICSDLLEHFDEEGIDKTIVGIKKNLAFDGIAIIRIGTAEMDCFDEDPTHVTKKDTQWWVNKFQSHGLELKYGPTEVGEFVVQNFYDDFSNYTPYMADDFKESKNDYIQARDKIQVKALRNISLSDGQSEILVFPRIDGKVQVSFDDKMFVSSRSVDSFDIYFGEKCIYLFELTGDKSAICKIPHELNYPLNIVNNTSITKHYQFDDCSKIEVESHGELSVSGKLQIHSAEEGDLFLLCNAMEEPFCYFAIRDGINLVFGMHFSPDSWYSKTIMPIESPDFTFKIEATIGNKYVVTVNDFKFEMDRNACGIDGSDVINAEARKCCVVYGRNQSKPLNLPTEKFSVEFTEVNGN